METTRGGMLVPEDMLWLDMFEGVRNLRQEDLLLDYTIIAEGRSFRVHRVLLAALCDYFKAAFRSGMKEAGLNEMELKGITSNAMATIISFTYTGALNLNWDNIMEIVSAASQLQSRPIYEKCCNFLVSEITVESYKDIESIANTYSLLSVRRSLEEYRLKHFSEIAKTEIFRDMSAVELCKLLMDERLRVDSEYKLYKYLLEWVRHDRKAREPLLRHLLHFIKFPFMRKVELDSLKKRRIATNLIEEATVFKGSPVNYILCPSPRVVQRGDRYIVTFGCSDNALHSCILNNNRWRHMEKALNQPKPFVNAAVVVVNNHGFVCGGGNESSSRACYLFAPRTFKWTRLQNMKERRRNFALVANGLDIYAIGGLKDATQPVQSVEKYSITKNSWDYVTFLQVAVSDLAACAHKGKVYIAGGMDEHNLHVRDCKVYNPVNKMWEKKPDTLQITFRPQMFAEGSCLYLVDTYRTDGVPLHLETFHLKTNQWTRTVLNGVFFSRYFSAIFMDRWIYFVGRNDVNDGKSKKYSITTREIVEIDCYPWPVDSPLCVVLKLPYRSVLRKMLNEVSE